MCVCVNLCFYWESTCVGFLSFTFLYPMRLLQPHLATLPISLEELGRNNFRNPQHPKQLSRQQLAWLSCWKSFLPRLLQNSALKRVLQMSRLLVSLIHEGTK